MQALQEVTQWDIDYKQPNHVYLVDGIRAVAYIPWGVGTQVWFSNPMQFDKRGRKFIKLKKNPFDVKPPANLLEVSGSKGNTYYVDPIEKTCSCPGFQYRSHCKHVEQACAI
jgi:hypothetical protein